MRCTQRTFLALSTLACLAAPARAQGVFFDPGTCEVTLNPGDSQTVQVTLTIPGNTSYDEMDLYFLSDNTGSMGPIIDNVKDEVADLADLVFGFLGHPDVALGIGRYRDFPTDAFAFEHQLDPSKMEADVLAAIDDWSAEGGFDGSEAQLFALHEIATNPAIGFRPDAKRIVFWFGDAPGHEPICPVLTGEAEDLTVDSIIADMLANGPGGTAVLPTSINSGAFANGLNHDPTQSAQDYTAFCFLGGLPGQATRVSQGTDGFFLDIQDPTQTTEALFTTFLQFLRQVRVSVQPSDILLPFVDSIDPPFYDIQIPNNVNQAVELVFTIQLSSDSCIENENEFTGRLTGLFDGARAKGQSKVMNISQPACESTCLLLAGLTPLDVPLDFGVPGQPDQLYVDPLFTVPVTLDSIPALAVPDDPQLAGVHVFTQIYMLNPNDFPGDPLKMSNAVDIQLGGPGTPFGSSSGMQHWLTAPAEVGGVIQVDFSIDGFESGD